MKQRNSQNKPKHVGPGKKIITLYIAESEHEALKTRAKSLGLSLSQHLRQLGADDVQKGGARTIEPR